MKVTKDKTENSQAFLTIEMEPAELEESLEESYHHLVKKTNIPGFRKGKASRAVLEGYIGKESLFDEALHHLLPHAYAKAIGEQKIEAIAQPHIEIVQHDPLIFKATVPLPPTVKPGDYHQLQFTPEPVELKEDDVNAAIEQLRHQHAIWEPVERPVEFDDMVVMDIESNVEGESFINQKEAQFQVIRDLTGPVPGFAEQIPGMTQGGEKEFNLQFPSDYSRGELAGKEASFKVKVAEIKQEKLPELNDELAEEIDPKFETLDSLREEVSSQLKLRAEERAKVEFEERVIEGAVDLAEVEFPPILVEIEVDQLLSQRLRRWQMSGEAVEEYLNSVNKTEEELREELRPMAAKRVTRSLVLGKIVDEEKIEVSDSEVETEVENMAESAGENKDELRKSLNTPQAHESIKQLLLGRQAVQRLIEIAKGSKIDDKTTKKEDKS